MNVVNASPVAGRGGDGPPPGTTSPTSRWTCSRPTASTRSASMTSRWPRESPGAPCSATTPRRTPSRGDFDSPSAAFAAVLDSSDPALPVRSALRTALLDFIQGYDFQTERHRLRMRLILENTELQAYSMTMYVGWRRVVADFVAQRGPERSRPTWHRRPSRGSCSAWLCRPMSTGSTMSRCRCAALGNAFDAVADGLP